MLFETTIDPRVQKCRDERRKWQRADALKVEDGGEICPSGDFPVFVFWFCAGFGVPAENVTLPTSIYHLSHFWYAYILVCVYYSSILLHTK